jgi:hypothetical protein
MSEFWTVRHPPNSVWEKMLMPGPVRYRNKDTQTGTGLLRLRNAPVPDRDAACRINDFGLNADAQLCQIVAGG